MEITASVDLCGRDCNLEAALCHSDTRRAQGGETFEVLVECYAGNGPQVCGGGPRPEGRLMVPPTEPQQSTVQKCEFGIWDEEVYQLWLDVETLALLAESIRDRESLRLTANRGMQGFTYAFYAWEGADFVDSGLIREAYALNTPLRLQPGAAPAPASLFALTASNVILETVKLAEGDSGDLVLRLYEAGRTATRTELSIGLPVTEAAGANMLEVLEALPLDGSKLSLTFRPLEIKTVRLKMKTDC